MSKRKYAKFVKLEIINDISFADDISMSDYRNKVINIYNGNRKKDKEFVFSESRYYIGYKRYNLLHINEENTIINQQWMCLLFYFFTVGWLYDIIMSCYCIHQQMIIRKIISTRMNLLEDEQSTKFSSEQPSLSIDVKMINPNETKAIFEKSTESCKLKLPIENNINNNTQDSVSIINTGA